MHVDCVSGNKDLKSVVLFFWKSSYKDERVNFVSPYEGQNKLRFIKFVNVTEFEVDFSLWRI